MEAAQRRAINPATTPAYAAANNVLAAQLAFSHCLIPADARQIFVTYGCNRGSIAGQDPVHKSEVLASHHGPILNNICPIYYNGCPAGGIPSDGVNRGAVDAVPGPGKAERAGLCRAGHLTGGVGEFG